MTTKYNVTVEGKTVGTVTVTPTQVTVSRTLLTGKVDVDVHSVMRSAVECQMTAMNPAVKGWTAGGYTLTPVSHKN